PIVQFVAEVSTTSGGIHCDGPVTCITGRFRGGTGGDGEEIKNPGHYCIRTAIAVAHHYSVIARVGNQEIGVILEATPDIVLKCFFRQAGPCTNGRGNINRIVADRRTLVDNIHGWGGNPGFLSYGNRCEPYTAIAILHIEVI